MIPPPARGGWSSPAQLQRPFLLLLLLLLQVCSAKQFPQRRRTSSFSPDEFAVHGLVAVEPAFGTFDGAMYAGVLPVTTADDKVDNVHNNNDDDDDDRIGHLMFWYFDAHRPTVDDTIVVWFNGGPGCSSFDAGLLFEFGPVVTPSRPAGFFGGADEANQPLHPNPYAWTRATDVVFVEQPVGTGFSYGGVAPHNEQDVATDLYNFLQHFYDTFPHARRQRLILAGESYAGMYIGGLAHYIHEQNQLLRLQGEEPRADDEDPERHDDDANDNDMINLAGLALGNAWIDATVQGPAVIDYAWWHGWIDATTRTALHAAWQQCYNVHDDNVDGTQQQGMRGNNFPTNADGTAMLHPFTVPDECGIMSVITTAAGAHQLAGASPNIYDVTTWDKYDLIIAHNSTIEGFFNRPEVRAALNVPKHDADRVWSGCIPGAGRRRRRQKRRKRRLTVNNDDRHEPEETYKEEEQPTTSRRDLLLLDQDRPISMKNYLATLLDEAQLPVLVYNGDRDLSTCAQGSELVLNDVPWRGHRDWQDPRRYTRGVWLVDDYPAGYAKTLHNLNFVVVYNSGHLVPMNQPKVALDMLERFLQNQSFIDRPLPTYSAADFDGTKKTMRQHEHHQQQHESANKDDDPSHWKSGHEDISTAVSSLLQQQLWWTIPFVSFVAGILVTVVATRLLLCHKDNHNKNRRQYTPIGEC